MANFRNEWNINTDYYLQKKDQYMIFKLVSVTNFLPVTVNHMPYNKIKQTNMVKVAGAHGHENIGNNELA